MPVSQHDLPDDLFDFGAFGPTLVADPVPTAEPAAQTGDIATRLDALRQTCLDRTAHGPLLAFPPSRLAAHGSTGAATGTTGTADAAERPAVRLTGLAPDALVHALQHGVPVILAAGHPGHDAASNRDLTHDTARTNGAASATEPLSPELPLGTDSDGVFYHEAPRALVAWIAGTPDDGERSLTAVQRAAQQTMDATASHALYLALGFLEWSPDDATSDDEATDAVWTAPLLLLPVTLRRGAPDEQTGTFTFTLEGTGDTPFLNAALRDQVRGAAQTELPELLTDERADAYFARVRQTIAHHPRWTVHRQAILTVLPLDRLMMYRDFDPHRWPEGRWPVTAPLDAVLSGAVLEDARQAPEYALDRADADPATGPLAFDADATQHSVVLDVCANRTVVMHAGPGTGATQTLANVVATLLATEKSVLVVSNNTAALDATRRTLDGAGLGLFTLGVYGAHATLPAVRGALSARLARRHRFHSVDLAEPLRELNAARERLAEYATLLNAPANGTGQTIHDVLWAVDRYRRQLGAAADAVRDVTLADAEQWSEAERVQRQACLDTICGHLSAVHDPSTVGSSHPWAGVDNPSLTYVDERALAATLETVVTRAIELASALNRLTRAAGWEVTPSIVSIDHLLSALDRLPALSDDVVPELLSRLHDPDIRAQATQWAGQMVDASTTTSALGDVASHAVVTDEEDAPVIHLGTPMREEDDVLPLPAVLREEEDVLPLRSALPEPEALLPATPASHASLPEGNAWTELANRCRPARVPRGAEIAATQRAILRLRDRAPRALTLSDALGAADDRDALAARLTESETAAQSLLDHVPRAFPITPATVKLLARALTAIESAPLADLAYRHDGLKDPNAAANLLVASQDSSVLRAMRDRLELRLTLEHLPTVSELRRYIAALGSAGALSFLDSSIANARKAHKALLRNDEKASIDEALRDCQLLATYIDRQHRFNAQPIVLQAAGEFADGINTPFDAMSRLARWYAEMCEVLPEHNVLAGELLDCLWTAPVEWLTAWRTTATQQSEQMAALNAVDSLLERAQATVFGLIVPEDQPIDQVSAALRNDAQLLRADIDTIISLGFDDATDWAFIEDVLRDAARLETELPAGRADGSSVTTEAVVSLPAAPLPTAPDDLLDQDSLDAFGDAFDEAFANTAAVESQAVETLVPVEQPSHVSSADSEAAGTPSVATRSSFLETLEITPEQCDATLAAYAALDHTTLPDELHAWLMSDDIAGRYQTLQQVKVHLGAQREAYRQAVAAFERGAMLDSRVWFDREDATFLTLSLTDVVRRSERAIAVPQRLSEWLEYLRARRSVRELGLTELVRKAESGALPPNKLRDAFEYLLQQALATGVLARHPALTAFDGAAHLALQRRYAVLDREVQRLRRRQIAYLADQRPVPFGIRSDAATTELAFLERLDTSDVRCDGVAEVFARAGQAVRALTPCVFMSAQSVGRYLEPGTAPFDYVILDDAARMTVDDAAGALARGQQAIVVGDPMRLAVPNNVLHAAASAYGVHRTLRRHHRSRHPATIAYANTAFYNESLVVLPAPAHCDMHAHAEPPILLDWVADGAMREGRNLPEAERVVDAVFAHIRRDLSQSLGVIAVTAAQRDAIADVLDQRLKADALARYFFETQAAREEPFYIKTASEAQGETRDVIVTSITVAPVADGEPPVMDAFVPLSLADGDRLLTVLSTSARQTTHVVSSLRADDVPVRGTSARGVCALKDFLMYAESHGGTHLHAAGRAPVTDFELAVAHALRTRGFETVANVQVSGEPIDLAVRDPRNPDHFVLGIRGDGANYNRPEDTRSRDRLQSDALARLGWPIAQLWSVQWLADPNGQADRLVDGLLSMLGNQHLSCQLLSEY